MIALPKREVNIGNEFALLRKHLNGHAIIAV